MRSITRFAAVFVSVMASVLLLPTVASAATGDITFTGCIADDGNAGCTDPVPDSLDGAIDVAVSPDGASVYSVAFSDASISRFARAANGGINLSGCIADLGASTCVDPSPEDPLAGAGDVAISPDGTSVYVVSATDKSISAFERAPDGTLTYDGCIADGGAAGCIDPILDSIGSPSDVVVSPDGDSVYVTSLTDSVTHFTRFDNGSISFANCVAENGAFGCVNPPIDALDGANGLAISPDGESAYVGAINDDAVSQFTRAPDGTLSFAGCVAEGGGSGCENPPTDSLDGASRIAVSPDGRSVYVASLDDTAVTNFNRASNGGLSFAGCVANGGASGCVTPALNGFLTATDVTVSPDGKSVYVISLNRNSITHLTRADNGGITFAGCIADDGSSGCVNPPQDPMSGATGVAVSPDGRSVYVASAVDDSISTFAREPLATADTTPPVLTLKAKKGEAGKPIKVSVTCDEACSVDLTGSAKPKGSKKGKLTAKSKELIAGELANLKLKPKGKLKKALRSSGKGKAKIAATATDAAGNSAEATKKLKLK